MFGKSDPEPTSLCCHNFDFNIRLENQYAVFEVDMKKGSWFGLGFGCSMTDSDTVLFEASTSGDIKVTDMYSRGPFYPDTDLI